MKEPLNLWRLLEKCTRFEISISITILAVGFYLFGIEIAASADSSTILVK